jgi:hypothetical protein
MVAAVNNKLYAIGGIQRDSAVGYVEEYNPILDSWVIKAPMPTARGYGVCGVVNGKIYCIGGLKRSNFPIDTVDVFDPLLNQWQRKRKMLTHRQGFDGSVIGDSIYVCGGYFSVPHEEYSDTVEVYNANRDSWFIRQSMNQARVEFGCAAVNNRLYAISGLFYSTYVNYNEEYNPAEDTWRLKRPIPVARSGLTCVVLNNKIFAIGGRRIGPGGGVYKRVDIYNAETDTWLLGDSINVARTYAGTAVVNGHIFIVGGQNQNISIASLEEYIPEGIEEPIGNWTLEIGHSIFSVYPNPFKYSTTFQLNNFTNQSAAINIYNNLGELVKLIPTNNSNKMLWNGTDEYNRKLATGIYFAKVIYHSLDTSPLIKMLILR